MIKEIVYKEITVSKYLTYYDDKIALDQKDKTFILLLSRKLQCRFNDSKYNYTLYLSNSYALHINKNNDEYYIVECIHTLNGPFTKSDTKFYLCDQLHGLKKLITCLQ